ncbi:hypothetical protein PSHT_04697 [Puccinia striiformis]|uniref:Uncharacterized protein n=1 Tax=Puccinia striiformis TaxID=27350 RepID=A0A2S4WCB1_9BASI|nr:hypothetical protein PSHT_04697 [Puccinia striiformis]
MSVDRWVKIYNASRKRKDKYTVLPTGCSPNFSYATPEHFAARNEIVDIPKDDIDIILQNDYPERSVMFTHTPDWFHQLATQIMEELRFSFDQICIGSIWSVFDAMLPYIQANIPPHFASLYSGAA